MFGGRWTTCESQFSFHHVGSRNRTPAIRLGSKCLLLNRLSWWLQNSLLHQVTFPCVQCAWIHGVWACDWPLQMFSPGLALSRSESGMNPACCWYSTVTLSSQVIAAWHTNPQGCAKCTGKKCFTHWNCVTCWLETSVLLAWTVVIQSEHHLGWKEMFGLTSSSEAVGVWVKMNQRRCVSARTDVKFEPVVQLIYETWKRSLHFLSNILYT